MHGKHVSIEITLNQCTLTKKIVILKLHIKMHLCPTYVCKTHSKVQLIKCNINLNYNTFKSPKALPSIFTEEYILLKYIIFLISTLFQARLKCTFTDG